MLEAILIIADYADTSSYSHHNSLAQDGSR